jgi:hypothetical protein
MFGHLAIASLQFKNLYPVPHITNPEIPQIDNAALDE